jgi:hypothetical protein
LTSVDLLKWILIKHGPANDVPHVGMGVTAKIGKKSTVTGESQEFRLDYLARAEVAPRYDRGPQCPQAFTE